MGNSKKSYTPPIAEQIWLVPSEAITANSELSPTWAVDGWQNKDYFNTASTVQAFGKWVWNEDGTISGS